MATVVLSVGQCGFDDSRLARLVRAELGAPMDRAPSAAEARRMIAEKKYDLILINRIFDGDGARGLDLIAELKKQGDAPPMMLVSDYGDAQAQAVANGAQMGFGKSAMAEAAVGQRLRSVVDSSSNPA